MRLVAIYNSWGDSADLLLKSIINIQPVVEGIIIVYSDWSYSGNFLEFPLNELPKDNIKYVRVDSSHNETSKRNLGLSEAKKNNYTHFIIMDNDEMYLQDDVVRERQYLEDHPQVSGLVSRVKVLFGKPTLICDDHTLVPFIQRLKPNTVCGRFKDYPFTSDEHGVHIDPTRRINVTQGIEMCDTVMYHASWIRKDFEMKIENSPAKANLRKSTIYEDLRNATAGYYCKFYRKHLTECENAFNL